MLTQDLCCIFVHDSGIFRFRVVYVAYLISLVFDACDLREISLRYRDYVEEYVISVCERKCLSSAATCAF